MPCVLQEISPGEISSLSPRWWPCGDSDFRKRAMHSLSQSRRYQLPVCGLDHCLSRASRLLLCGLPGHSLVSITEEVLTMR